MTDPIKILIRMTNPYSKTSVWEDESCNQFSKIIIVTLITIFVVVFGLFTLNVYGIMGFKVKDNSYNYTTGCGHNRTGKEGCSHCYYNDSKTDEMSVVCLNPYHIADFMLCTLMGFYAIIVILIMIFIILVIMIAIYFIVVDLIRIISDSYHKSNKD